MADLLLSDVSKQAYPENLDPGNLEPGNVEEQQYLDFVDRVIRCGIERDNRTAVATRSIFGTQLRYNLRDGRIPLLTTKRVPWKSVVEELLWMLRGSTDSKELSAKGIRIWDANGSREFLDGRGLAHRQVGDLGPVYGFQWRHFGAPYVDLHLRDTQHCVADTKDCSTTKTNDIGTRVSSAFTSVSSECTPVSGPSCPLPLVAASSSVGSASPGVDQIRWLVERIKSHPTCRRLLLTAWNPVDLHLMALPPCHVMAQFWVDPNAGELSCHLVMRSNDLGLGLPFNIASYALLTHLLAHLSGLRAGELIHSTGDAHVYVTHLEALKIQLGRTPRPFPTLSIVGAEDVVHMEDFRLEHLQLSGYNPHPAIPMKMVV